MLISGGSIVSGGQDKTGEVIVEYNAYAILTEELRFLLKETAGGLVFVEREKDGGEAIAKTHWQEKDGDHFAIWIGLLAGKAGAAEYIVPFDRTKSAKRIFYGSGEYTILQSHGVTRPVANQDGAGSEMVLVPRVEQSLRIGRSGQAILSRDAVKYLFVVENSDYASDTNVLIVEEPHFDDEAQWNLCHGLEVFLSDNPWLPERTVFLAEGLQRDYTFPIEVLRESTLGRPDDELLHAVLESFLIPGYIGLEWKRSFGIPIIGAEDGKLYDDGARLWVTLETTDHSVLAAWKRSVAARNQSLAATLIEKIKEYGNPILFVGGMHLRDDATQERNHGLRDYLKENRIGYTFLAAQDGTLSKRELTRNHDRYVELFITQANNDYGEYIDWLLLGEDLSELREVGGLSTSTTVQPSAAGAAQYVKALQYEKNSPRKERNREIGRLWKDWNKHKEKWRKVTEKPDPKPPPGGKSVRELWEKPETGEYLGIHEKTGIKTTIVHPHPFDPFDLAVYPSDYWR